MRPNKLRELLKSNKPTLSTHITPPGRPSWKLWHRLLRRSASESGRLRHRDGGHEGGDRRRTVLMLAIL
jgi:hypothetical protein